MRKARYEFERNRRYFAWAVAVEALDLPGYGKLISVIRMTLATPFVLESGDRPKSSHRMEAVAWLYPDHAADDQFLRDIGVIQVRGQYKIRGQKYVWCEFGDPSRRSGYQPIIRHGVIPAGTYSAPPIVVEEQKKTGIAFDSNSVRFRGKRIRLTNLQQSLLQELDRYYPGRVSLDVLRRAIPKWRRLGPTEQAMRVAIAELRKVIRPTLDISPQDGDDGWALIVSSGR